MAPWKFLSRICKLLSDPLSWLSDFAYIAARNNNTVLVNNSDGPADYILHLVYNGLEQAIWHILQPILSDKNKKTRDIHAVLLILYYIVTDF